jgi:hypothetical protein
MKKLIHFVAFLSVVTNLSAQTLVRRSQEFSPGAAENKDSSVPIIRWISPANETAFLKEDKLDLKFEIESKHALSKISLSIREKDQEPRGASQLKPTAEQSKKFVYEKTIMMLEGVSIIELTVENEQGVKTVSQRTIHVGQTALADAVKLQRKDYALIFATDKYDNWKGLVNPIFDARTISSELKNTYGFEVDLNENLTQEEVWKKILEYTENKKYNQLDQLLIFFAGHGFYDESFKEGFLVTRESLPNDPGRQTYISYDRLRGRLNNIPCEHIFLVMDVCFGGTFDESIASRKLDDADYKEASQSTFITRVLEYRTRKYLTSGGREYVSDGIPGKHSPFARKMIDALRTHGGDDGMLTLSELKSHLEKLEMRPRFGKFGSDAPESEFVFVVK